LREIFIGTGFGTKLNPPTSLQPFLKCSYECLVIHLLHLRRILGFTGEKIQKIPLLAGRDTCAAAPALIPRNARHPPPRIRLHFGPGFASWRSD
jgi:hypothetical protein